MFVCDKFRVDAYKARANTLHYDTLCAHDYSKNSNRKIFEHFYLLIRNEFDRTYTNLGVPVFLNSDQILLQFHHQLK